MNNENKLNPPVLDGYIKIPTFKLWVANRFPYIETDFDAITTYDLMEALTNYLNNVIKNEENVEKNLSSLYDFCVLLNNKINQIYNNIDNIVENEIENILNQMVEDGIFDDIINNKLDQMVEDGIFDDILTRVIPQNILQKFDTLQDLKNANLNVGDIALTLGYYSKFDGGKALYKITDNSSIDNIFTYSMQNGNTIELLDKNNFNILQIGAKRNDNTFDNKLIFESIFKEKIENTLITIPDGVYYTTSVNYDGDNLGNKNVKYSGVGKPTIKLLQNVTKTTKGTYNANYFVSDNIGVLDFGENCTISTIQLKDNKIYYYLAISNKSLIPDSLVKNLVVEGNISHTKAVIASIDKNDPDGENTARIYLFETYNDFRKQLNFNSTNNILTETLKIKESLNLPYLYIRFADNIIPSYIAVNNQLEQINNGKKARINKIDINFNDTNYIRLNCYERNNIFDENSLYLENNLPFNINEYSNYSRGIFSLNKMENITIDNIIFDGSNLDISYYQSQYNNRNLIITGGSKNILFSNCIFKNSIMAGLQIGGIGNSNSPINHDYPENITVSKCYFENNGRGDLEIIYGHNINVLDCIGDGDLDIETNGNEMLNNININNCQFNRATPYSPGVVDGQTMINFSNSKFFTLISQGKIVLNLNNVIINNLEPQLCLIKGVNCYINQITGLNGNEQLDFVNSSFYSLYQENPGGQRGNTIINFKDCIIDLSLSDSNKLTACKEISFDNSILISTTTKKNITDNRCTYNVNNCIFNNVGINSITANSSTVPISRFKNCLFKSKDDSDTSYSINGPINCHVENCEIETNILIATAKLYILNSIISSITKPHFKCNLNYYVSGLKTQDGLGIDWDWLQTPGANQKVEFNDIQFKDTFTSNTLGIYAGVTAVSINSVSDNCRGYYVGNSDKAFVKLYYNDTAIAKKEISFT